LPDIQWEDGDSLWRPPSPGGTPTPLPTQQMPQGPPTETVPVVPIWARPLVTTETVSLIDEAPHQIESDLGESRPGNEPVEQRWRAVAGNGVGAAWLVWNFGLIWSLWRQADPAFFGDSSLVQTNAERFSLFLKNIGGNLIGIFSTIGMVALAASALSSSRRHRTASWLASGYALIGLITAVGSAWSMIQFLHDGNGFNGFAVGRGPSELTALGGLIGAVTVVALAVMVLRHRPEQASPFDTIDSIESIDER
jgi:hypothetical protein